MNILVIIPARGGSKEIPRKNIKVLGDKPLISYSIEIAKKIAEKENICVSTDDDAIIELVKNSGLEIPFKRPEHLSSDTATTNDVLLHALNFYEEKGKTFDAILLLQPTSPFRKKEFISEALSVYNNDLDMVVSVRESSSNPYFNCFEENELGYLKVCKGNGTITRRQDAPKTWEYNGSIYLINVSSLKSKKMAELKKIRKIEMPTFYSIDIDNIMDWKMAELILKEKLISL